MALRAKFKFETDVFFMILLRKIMKNTSVSKEYSAAEGGKNLLHTPKRLFIQAPKKSFAAKPRISPD
jgi:hypothetical protein